MAIEEHSPPASVDTWLEKKYLNSKIPFGVCIYFWVVTLEIVDSCISTTSAISLNTSGFMAIGAEFQKFILMRYDTVSDFKYGFTSTLQTFQKPFGLLQVIFHAGVVRTFIRSFD